MIFSESVGSRACLSAEALPTERRKPANEPFAGFFVRYARYDVAGEGMRLRPNRSGPLSAAARTSRTNKRRRRLHICKRLSTFGASIRRGARVVEEARLESSYTSQAYQGFESPSLREFAADEARTPARILAGVSFFCGADFRAIFRMAAGRIPGASIAAFDPTTSGVCRESGRGIL